MSNKYLFILFSLLSSYSAILCQQAWALDTTKKVDLSVYGYPILLSCHLPPGAEVKKEYESLSIQLTEKVSIESIAWHKKNDYDWTYKSALLRSSADMLESARKKTTYSSSDKEYKIVESYENGLYILEKRSYRTLIHLLFFFETDEMIYELKCDPIFNYTEEELKLVLAVISTIKPIPYCYKKAVKIDSSDYFHDFTEMGYGFKMNLPPESVIRNNKSSEDYKMYHSDFDIQLYKGEKYTSVYQYSLPNKIDLDFSEKKREIRDDPSFVRMIYDDSNGYLAELAPSGFDYDQYVFYVYHKSELYFYVFRTSRNNLGDNRERLSVMTLESAKEAYFRARDISLGKTCD